jgi:hypothetical protein
MSAPLIASNVVPVIPGVYFQMNPSAEATVPVIGVVAVVGVANDGPVASAKTLTSLGQLDQVYASGAGRNVAAEAWRGGALQEVFVRAGQNDGVVATKTLVDTTGSPINAVRLDWKNPGTRGNGASVTVVDSIAAPSTTRTLSLFINAVLVESFNFAKGSSGIGEPQALVDAIGGATGTNSSYLNATKLADGTKILATVASPTTFASGANPTVNAAAYTTAMGILEGVPWNVAVFDTQDTVTIQPSIVTWAKTLEGKGLYRLVAIGDPVSVTPTVATRYGRAAGFNQWNLLYVGDQFVRTNFDGTTSTVEGAEAAGRVAGLVAKDDIVSTSSAQLLGTDVTALSASATMIASDVAASIQNGMIVFNLDDNRRAQIAAGVTSYVTLDGVHSRRWKNILRVVRRYRLMINVSAAWQHLDVENDENGRGTVIAKAQDEIDTLVKGRYFTGGSCQVSLTPTPPTDDLAYFLLNVTDQGKIERLVGMFQFP